MIQSLLLNLFFLLIHSIEMVLSQSMAQSLLTVLSLRLIHSIKMVLSQSMVRKGQIQMGCVQAFSACVSRTT